MGSVTERKKERGNEEKQVVMTDNSGNIQNDDCAVRGANCTLKSHRKLGKAEIQRKKTFFLTGKNSRKACRPAQYCSVTPLSVPTSDFERSAAGQRA